MLTLFLDVELRNPLQNMNQSEIVVMFKSGLGVRVQESFGMLDVMVTLPPNYNTTCRQVSSIRSPSKHCFRDNR